MRNPSYRQSQWLWLLWILLPASGVAMTATLWALTDRTEAGVAAAALLLLPCVLLALGRFTVEVDANGIEWHFGWFGRPRWHLAMAEIVRVEVARSTWLEGWGIRRTREGMLYNASGHGAVRLHLRDGRCIRLGSDEPERLAAFIGARL